MPQASPGVVNITDRRRRGRPKSVESPARRKKRIRLAKLVLMGIIEVQEAALILGVHRVTFSVGIRELIADGNPDTDDIRELTDCM